MRRSLLYMLEGAAILTVAAGVGMIFVPAGLIVLGLAVAVLIEANS